MPKFVAEGKSRLGFDIGFVRSPYPSAKHQTTALEKLHDSYECFSNNMNMKAFVKKFFRHQVNRIQLCYVWFLLEIVPLSYTGLFFRIDTAR